MKSTTSRALVNLTLIPRENYSGSDPCKLSENFIKLLFHRGSKSVDRNMNVFYDRVFNTHFTVESGDRFSFILSSVFGCSSGTYSTKLVNAKDKDNLLLRKRDESLVRWVDEEDGDKYVKLSPKDRHQFSINMVITPEFDKGSKSDIPKSILVNFYEKPCLSEFAIYRELPTRISNRSMALIKKKVMISFCSTVFDHFAKDHYDGRTIFAYRLKSPWFRDGASGIRSPFLPTEVPVMIRGTATVDGKSDFQYMVLELFQYNKHSSAERPITKRMEFSMKVPQLDLTEKSQFCNLTIRKNDGENSFSLVNETEEIDESDDPIEKREEMIKKRLEYRKTVKRMSHIESTDDLSEDDVWNTILLAFSDLEETKRMYENQFTEKGEEKEPSFMRVVDESNLALFSSTRLTVHHGLSKEEEKEEDSEEEEESSEDEELSQCDSEDMYMFSSPSPPKRKPAVRPKRKPMSPHPQETSPIMKCSIWDSDDDRAYGNRDYDEDDYSCSGSGRRRTLPRSVCDTVSPYSSSDEYDTKPEDGKLTVDLETGILKVYSSKTYRLKFMRLLEYGKEEITRAVSKYDYRIIMERACDEDGDDLKVYSGRYLKGRTAQNVLFEVPYTFYDLTCRNQYGIPDPLIRYRLVAKFPENVNGGKKPIIMKTITVDNVKMVIKINSYVMIPPKQKKKVVEHFLGFS